MAKINDGRIPDTPTEAANERKQIRAEAHHLWPTGETNVDKPKKTAAELEDILKQRISAGDFKVTVHSNPETGWHATIYGRQPSEVHRCQVMAETIVTELCQYYNLAS